ncbi:hypothetical protein C8F04DRAFT_1106064, partial [Mycena alexandri]
MTSKGQVRKSSCRACHQRRVRCDGQIPCGSCSRARKSSGCEYISPTSPEGSSRVGLPRGSACISCRQKKRKCNGKLPCSTCKDALRPDACQYRTKHSRREHEDTGSHQELSDTSLQVCLQYPWANSVEKNTTAINFNSPIIVIPTPNIRGPPHAIDHNPERYSLRALWVECCTHYGLHFSVEKRQAIARGDTSGAVIHPIFIPLAELMGFLLVDLSTSERWAHLRGQTAKETERRLHILNRLNCSRDALDPLTSVQVHQTLALYWVKKRDFQAFQEILVTLSEIAMALCCHVTTLGLGNPCPPAGPASQEVVEEGRSALANGVFIEIISLTYVPLQRNIRPILLVRFRRFLAKAAEQHNQLELNFIRAKSALLFEESQQLVTEWNDCDSGSVVGKEWSERCRNQANNLQSHLHVLKLAMLAMTAKSYVVAVKVCTISTLAALAELHAILAPFHAVARQKYRNIVDVIAGITRTFSLEEHESCDFLEVCWEIASRDISEQSPTPKWREYLENVALSSFSCSPQEALHFLSPTSSASESGPSSPYTPASSSSDSAAFSPSSASPVPALDATCPIADDIGLLMDSALLGEIPQTTKPETENTFPLLVETSGI